MIKSYGAENWQMVEAAGNVAELNGGQVIAITDHGDLPGFRLWVRWLVMIPVDDPVAKSLLGHRSSAPDIIRKSVLFDEEPWLPIETAPRDGRRMRLRREDGKIIIGRWDIKPPTFTHEFGWHHYEEEKWLDDDDKFIEIPDKKVICWLRL